MLTLFNWWNVIFALPLSAGLILSLSIAFTGLGLDIGGTADAEVAEADVDAADAGMAGADADIHDGGHHSHDIIGHDADIHDAEGDGHSARDVPFVYQVLGFFGLGKGVPLTVMLPLLFVIWGAGGLMLNAIFEPLLNHPGLFAPLSLSLSFFVTAFAGQGMALGLRRLLGTKETSISSQDLLGLPGQAVYQISQEGGVAHVRDPYGNIHRILCKTNTETIIAANQAVTVIAYDASKKHYIVEPARLEEGV